MRNKIVTKLLTCTLSAGLILSGCGNTSVSSTTTEVTDSASTSESTTAIGQTVSGPAREDITVNETIENNEDGEHAIEASGEDASYSNVEVIKTGDSDEGDEADFYGDNAAIFATDGATLDLSEIVVDTNGTHANGVFSYGEGTTVNISDSY
ncbi:MAG: hypothetical protein J6H22_03330, partial [Pseudobutyrivibrio sp.]|nr:hypothetical protein [Pseudobutyrivibrio sp.]